jgi:hypothetical protein
MLKKPISEKETAGRIISSTPAIPEPHAGVECHLPITDAIRRRVEGRPLLAPLPITAMGGQ